MPAGQFKINGVDAYTAYGLSLDASGMSAILAPPPLKPMIENSSAVEHGKRVIRTDRRYDERTITISMNMVAATQDALLTNMAAFYSELADGPVNIQTKYQQNTEYHFDYLSVQAFNEYGCGIAHIVLRVVEPNPNDHAVRANKYSTP